MSPSEAPNQASKFARLCKFEHFTNVCGAIDGTFIFTWAGKEDKDPLISYKWSVPSLLLLVICDAERRIRWFSPLRPASWGDKAIALATDITGLEGDIVRRRVNRHRHAPPVPEGRMADRDTGSAFQMQDLSKSFFEKLFFEVPRGFVVLADGGFAFRPHIIIPGGDAVRKAIDRDGKLSEDDARLKQHEKSFVFDRTLNSQRVVVERTFGGLIGSFDILRCGRYPIMMMDMIVQACVVIHNVRIDLDDHPTSHPATGVVLLSQVMRKVARPKLPTSGRHVGIPLRYDDEKSALENRLEWMNLLDERMNGAQIRSSAKRVRLDLQEN